MKTTHKLIISDSRNLTQLANESIDLVVTSPPYPMIQMWDQAFASMSKDVKSALAAHDGNTAFEAMHLELDKVWAELKRVIKPGSFACINIGDATRNFGARFQLYPNHSRIIHAFKNLGFDMLPAILWRKQTNAPNKFMGSGMLPAGAYVTLEHEFILVFRKGPKREFESTAEKARRMQSAFFWEERNKWFSDVWDFKGASQELDAKEIRSRSAAYPLELAYRLINMYSLYDDIVLDPFIGTGTTSLAAIACGRKSVGVEIDISLAKFAIDREKSFREKANEIISDRILRHREFVDSRNQLKGPLKYNNSHLNLPVFTRQETQLQVFRVKETSKINDFEINALYEPFGPCVSVTLT
jgi:modification methylase